MTKQEQIDWLKQVVAKQQADIDHLSNTIGALHLVFNQPPTQPTCEVCHATMYEGFVCGASASECPMGVGVSIES